MKAFVSGQSGVAVLNKGEHWYVIRPPHYDLTESRLTAAIRILDGSTDVKEIEDAEPESIRLELEAALARDTALQYTLVLEARESGELQRSILERLEKLLLFPDVPEFILNRLYAAPLLPSARHYANALLAEHPNHPISSILPSVLEDQKAVGRLRSAWDSVSTGLFPSVREKELFFYSAVEQGLVRRLARTPDHLLEGGGIGSDANDVLRNWIEAARQFLEHDVPNLVFGQGHKPFRAETTGSDHILNIQMTQIETLHHKATTLADLAYAAKRAGNDDDAHQHLLAALHAGETGCGNGRCFTGLRTE